MKRVAEKDNDKYFKGFKVLKFPLSYHLALDL